ncbi:putative F-box/LRR-repeat protein 23 [Spatholobus suberectus]|nr:putative F-box/LRR-repeat protein 23 [Spatholobus suberectus]
MESSPSSSKAVADTGERNWVDLPRDVVCTIFQKLGAIETLTRAQRVCSVWRSISKDPLLWRSVDMRNSGNMDLQLGVLCRRAIDYSSGHLLHVNIEHFGTDDLLHYITDSTSHLRCLRLACCYQISDEGLREVAKKLPQLVELDISISNLTKDSLEAIGRCCPQLKSLKFNMEDYRQIESDEEAFAIAETMPKLCHLQLFGNKLTNDGLLAILDGCPHLESLDLRQCFNVNLGGSLGRRCAEQIKNLRLPYDPTDDYPFQAEIDYGSPDEDYPSGISDIDFLTKLADLPQDMVCTIFQKLGAVETLTRAPHVCSLWSAISKDSLVWRSIDMRNSEDMDFQLGILCRRAVDCSSGHLLHINIEHFGTDDLLHYITDSTSHLRCLRLAYCYQISDEGFCEVAKKLPQLEELDISISNLTKDALKAIGRCCPHLKSLKFNIEETMPKLCHLQLFGNKLTNDGLLAILDGCPHLESLDLRQCFNVNLGGSLGRRCAEQINDLWLPYDPADNYPFYEYYSYSSLYINLYDVD